MCTFRRSLLPACAPKHFARFLLLETMSPVLPWRSGTKSGKDAADESELNLDSIIARLLDVSFPFSLSPVWLSASFVVNNPSASNF